MKGFSVLALCRVNSEQAHLVANAFVAVPSVPSEPTVRAAYAELSDQAGRWLARLTTGRARRPVRVVFTRCEEPYADAQELSESVRFNQVLEMFPAAYERDRRHPLLDASVGGGHDCLRAVHDIVSHGWLGYSFDRDGEFSAWRVEHRMYRGLARWALATELHAQHSVLWTSGELAEFKATLLSPDLLLASLRGSAMTTSKSRNDRKVNTMTDAQSEEDDDKTLFLQQLVNDRATIAADVVEVDPHTWAIHGFIPVGGDVIMAEFETQDQAKEALGKLSAPEYGPPAP
jgi:hypothetical protein